MKWEQELLKVSTWCKRYPNTCLALISGCVLSIGIMIISQSIGTGIITFGSVGLAIALVRAGGT